MYKRPLYIKKNLNRVNGGSDIQKQKKTKSQLHESVSIQNIITFTYCPVMGAIYTIIKQYGRTISFH
jgi:hypothetical protein